MVAPLLRHALLLVLALSGTAVLGQALLTVGYRGLQRPSKYGPRHPELIFPPELPGRQALTALVGPDDTEGALTVDGARRYLNPVTLARGRKWHDIVGVLQVVPPSRAMLDTTDAVEAFRLIGERAAKRYAPLFEALDLPTFSPDNEEVAMTAVDILWVDYVPRLEPKSTGEMRAWRALLALCSEMGWKARVSFGVVYHRYVPAASRVVWLEVLLPDAGWTVVTEPGGVSLSALREEAAGLVTYGFLNAPGLDPDEVAAVPAYAEPIVEAWLKARSATTVSDASEALFTHVLPYYRVDDERFVAETDAILALAPDNFRARLFRAVSLSRLGRREEAIVNFQQLLARRKQLSREDYAHLLWAFAKYVAWGGDTALATRIVWEADEVLTDIEAGELNVHLYKGRMRDDKDWKAIRLAQEEQ